jgi:hypothetical protein
MIKKIFKQMNKETKVSNQNKNPIANIVNSERLNVFSPRLGAWKVYLHS